MSLITNKYGNLICPYCLVSHVLNGFYESWSDDMMYSFGGEKKKGCKFNGLVYHTEEEAIKKMEKAMREVKIKTVYKASYEKGKSGVWNGAIMGIHYDNKPRLTVTSGEFYNIEDDIQYNLRRGVNRVILPDYEEIHVYFKIIPFDYNLTFHSTGGYRPRHAYLGVIKNETIITKLNLLEAKK